VSDQSRFQQYVAVDPETGCHNWLSTIKKDGYGTFWLYDRVIQAHRAAWRLFEGPIPEGKLVLHHCDNRRCVNVDHLYIGTHKQNTADAIARDRGVGRRKTATPERVMRARELREKGWSQQRIGDAIGCTQSVVSKILRGDLLYARRN